jgi:hypothetical protein
LPTNLLCPPDAPRFEKLRIGVHGKLSEVNSLSAPASQRDRPSTIETYFPIRGN